MKLLQLNMWMGRLTRQIVSLIEHENPDIITAQEVFNVDGSVVFPDRMFDLAKYVQDAGGFEYVYFSPTFDTQIAHETAPFGNAIFSKLPIIASETIITHGKLVHDMTAQNYIENTRNAQFVTLTIGDTNVLLVNHHAYWENTPTGSAASVASMQHVVDKLRTYSNVPIIVAGDMNLNPDTAGMHLYDGLLENLTASHGITSTLSVLGKVQDVACDHILVNELVQVVDFHVVDELVSDHKALVLEFDIR